MAPWEEKHGGGVAGRTLGWGGGIGKKECSAQGSPRGDRARPGRGFSLVSPGGPHPQHSVSFLGSDEPEPHGQSDHEEGEEQPLGPKAEVSGRVRGIARIWGQKEARRVGLARGRGRSPLRGRPPAQIPHGGLESAVSCCSFSSVSGHTCSSHRSSGTKIRGAGGILKLSQRVENLWKLGSTAPPPSAAVKSPWEGGRFWIPGTLLGGAEEGRWPPVSGVPVPAQKGPARTRQERALLMGLVALQV